jgi:phosphatidylserine/phosphatidylglycerophosphate/cardiolipin synthase-like enzyme
MERVESNPERYREMIVCAPYIDDLMAARLGALREASLRRNCGLRVITNADAADALRKRFGRAPRRGDLVVRSDLHAKIYLAVGRRTQATEAIITSPNLTRAGMERNIEFGVRIGNSTTQGRDLLRQVHRFLSKMAA